MRDDVVRVRIRFADGGETTLRQERGYVLYAVPAGRLTSARGAVAAEGLAAGGRVVGRTPFLPPRR